MMARSGTRCGASRQHRGNALIAALLALAVSALTATTVLKNRRIEQKRESGVAEATILDKLRNAVHAAMFENLHQLQQGQPLAKGEHSVPAEDIGGELVWRPSILQLRTMGYLPEGWNATASSINGAAYAISFRRTPSGCAGSACDLEGQVLITRPILDAGPGTPVDGVLIGPILTRAGADGGVSLATSPEVITGFGSTWTIPNPVAGNPPGVVAMRVGTNTGGFTQFVRIGDLRDPNLGGNLSAAGNLNIAGNTTLNGDTALNGNLTASDATGNPCVTLDRTGIVSVACAGTLNARTGVFTEQVSANGGLVTGSATAFASADPYAIQVSGGEMFIRGTTGTLVTFRGGDVIAEGRVVGASLSLSRPIVEAGACGTSATDVGSVQYSAAADGSLAACVGSRWVVVSRIASAGSGCGLSGASATDASTGQTVVCRSGRYVPMSALLSSFVLMDTLSVAMTASPVFVPKPVCETGFTAVEPLIILTPNNEDALLGGAGVLSGVNRFAVDRGAGWDVHLQRSADSTPLAGNVVASIYCFYN